MINKTTNEQSRLAESQKEMRYAFLGGFAGQFVSGIIWLVASAVSLYVSTGYGMAALFFGSMGIFPLTQMLLRMMGRPAKVSNENGLWYLGTQVAFTVPLNFLLVGAATLYRLEWFFPAAMIVVGTHYLPFITLYGMKIYGVLSALLVVGGATIALYGPLIFSLGGWIAGILLVVFAFIVRAVSVREKIHQD